MSSDFSSHVIKKDIDAKKAKLEALKAKRLARLAQQAEETENGRSGTPIHETESAILSPRTNDTSFASELDRSLSIRESDLGDTPTISLNASRALDESFNSLPDGPPTTSGSLNSPGNLLGRTYSSKLRLSSSKQLQAIKDSLDEIAQHSTTTPAASKRPSMTPEAAALSSPKPVAPITSAAVSSGTTSNHEDSFTIASSSNSPNTSIRSIARVATPPIATPADPAAKDAMIDDLLAQIRELSESVRSKNEDLAMAGDLGSVLLQSNEDANKRIEDLQILVDQQTQELLHSKDDCRASERKAKKLQQHLNDVQHLQQESESELEILRMELELERQNLRQSELELLKFQSDKSAEENLQDLTKQLNEAKRETSKMESLLLEERKRLEEKDEILKNLRVEHGELQKDLDEAEKYQSKVLELQEQLNALKAQDTVTVLAELQWENQRLQEGLIEYQKQFDLLQESNARDQELLRSLQAGNEQLQKQLSDSKLSTHTGKVFESLQDDYDEEPVAAVPIPAPGETSHTDAKESDEAHALRMAKAAAAMHLGSLPSKMPRSSLASGSASLAYTPEKGTTDEEKSDSPIKPIIPQAHITPPHIPTLSSQTAAAMAGHRGALSPGHGAAHAHAALAMPSKSGVGMFGFLSTLLPGSSSASAAASTTDPAARRLNFERTNSHPLAGGGGLAQNPKLKLVQYPAQPRQPSNGGVWDEDELAEQAERNSSHASAISGRKVGERDADWEFFSLTLLCVKIHSARKMESLYTISTQDLWLKAKNDDIPFHQYYSWLEDQLTKAYVSKLAAAKKTAGQHSTGEEVLDSYLPSNSAVPSTPQRGTLNTAATRVQLQTPIANSPNLSKEDAAGSSGSAPAVRVVQGDQPFDVTLSSVEEEKPVCRL